MASEDRTRRSVMLAVREQVLLSRNLNSNSETWTQQQWWQSYNFMFACAPAPTQVNAQTDSHDDLLFFVHNTALPPKVRLPKLLNQEYPFSVRRRGTRLPSDFEICGPLFPFIRWDHSFMLNLVLQGHYSLTVVACKQHLLPQLANGNSNILPNVRAVTKQVYASATRTPVNLDSSSKTETGGSVTASYPDICFSVDNFDDAFEEMVLSEPEECYCVMLHALLDAPYFSHQEGENPPAGSSGGLNRRLVVPRLSLFSGYVKYDQVYTHLQDQMHAQASQGVLASLFSRAFKAMGGASQEGLLAEKSCVHMTGPGGLGSAEVAVTSHQPGDRSSRQPSLEPGYVYMPYPPRQMLQCALMALTLPVDVLAKNLLEAVAI